MSIFMAITVMFQKGYTYFQSPWEEKQQSVKCLHLLKMSTSFESGKFTMC